MAFAGRSNVGKSALLNRLVRRRGLARVSRTPGRTREINFFCVNDAFVLADLPGYGYARVSKEQQAGWRPLIESYFQASPALRGAVQLLDVRREPTPEDRELLDYLAALQMPVLVVATKIDKLSRSAAAARVASLRHDLDLDDTQVIAFSSVTGEGRDELAAAIASLVSN